MDLQFDPFKTDLYRTEKVKSKDNENPTFILMRSNT